MAADGNRRIVIGVGNPDRGDDGAGRVVARRLRGILPVGIGVTEESGEATALMARMEGMTDAWLVDACRSGAAAGTVHRFDASDTPLPHGAFGASTHGFGVAEAIELARALDQLPPRCIVYAIEGTCFETGSPLSPQVARAVEDVAARLRTEFAGRMAMEGRADA